MSETKKMTNERPVYAFNRKIFCEGMRDGIPIALGYLAVSFSLGIAARNAGSYLPVVSSMSSGTRTIILTVVISSAAAILFPRKTEA